MLVREAKAAAYHCRALEATALAESSILDRVREKHEVAAARWRELAALNERAPGLARNREETPCIA